MEFFYDKNHKSLVAKFKVPKGWKNIILAAELNFGYKTMYKMYPIICKPWTLYKGKIKMFKDRLDKSGEVGGYTVTRIVVFPVFHDMEPIELEDWEVTREELATMNKMKEK